jgi:hypothetical protein
MLSALTLGAVSCKKKGCTDATATNYNSEAKKDDNSCKYADPVVEEGTITVSSNITSNTTWLTGKIYILSTSCDCCFRSYIDNPTRCYC